MGAYIAVVEKDPDSAWCAWFPDVPGCFSAADEFENLVPNAREALEFFFESVDAPT